MLERRLKLKRLPGRFSRTQLAALCSAGEVVLWFGPRIGGHLAMLQCADFIPEDVDLSVIDSISYPSLNQSATDLAWQNRKSLGPLERSFLRELWRLFRDPSPVAFHELVRSAPATGWESKIRPQRISGVCFRVPAMA